ncbi:MAG: type IX secretion system sortase PorU, partial [Bacteroides sp.]|nr:type IX secretion system sortase PorU [Bacteroides sp.]
MKHFLALFISLIFYIGTIQAQDYPAPSARKGYSVLAAGQTLKVAVAQDAVYKISYEDLFKQGLLANPIASHKIALYGNTAGMLPTFNVSGIYDDLSPLPIYLHDGGDGSFGPGDYFLFYGQSPHRWAFSQQSQEFSYIRHYFCDSAFYFVSLNAELEHRIVPLPKKTNTGENLTWFPEHIHHENDLVNLCDGGLVWFGESFTFSGNTRNITLSTPDPISGKNGVLYITTGAQSLSGTASFRVQCNNRIINLFVPNTTSAYNSASANDSVPILSESSSVNITFSKTGSTNNGYLDYLSIIYSRQLRLNGASLFFRHTQAIDKPVLFNVEATSSTQIWDISDVYHITSVTPDFQNGLLKFGTEPDGTLHEYVAFNPDLCSTPSFRGLVQPQNLHQLENIDYIVVTHPLFLEQAEEVARIHRERDHYTTCVVTTEQVYNEFSSGAKDPSAIRMFLRHLSVRSEPMHKPVYLLLFGDASFDYKGILGKQTDFVPTMQTHGKSTEGANDPMEDAFGYLSDNAGVNPSNLSTTGTIEVAIGRLPVHTVQEAVDMVEKINIYSSPAYTYDPTRPSLSGNFGPWRNEIVFITDDGFESEMEKYIISNDYIRQSFPYMHVNKLYSDAYERSSSATTDRIPALEKSIQNFIENGCLFMGYEGHSGWDAWSDERILTGDIIETLKHSYTYPVIFSSSCTFAYFDQLKNSGAERIMLKPHAGAIATIASSRTATTGNIEDIQKRFAEKFIDKTQDSLNSIGQAFLYAKTTSKSPGLQKFILLGDPGLKAALPQNNIQTLHINGKPANTPDIDTLKALSSIFIEGRILNRDGDPLNHFNGRLSIKVYDKPTVKQTLGLYNARLTGEDKHNPQYPYTDQSSIIFQGETEVKDGYFSFSFIVPKDIQYNYGNGRISYYAYNDETDANGSFDGIVVGGMNPNAVIDTTAPVVDLYINKNTFSGGTVG